MPKEGYKTITIDEQTLIRIESIKRITGMIRDTDVIRVAIKANYDHLQETRGESP